MKQEVGFEYLASKATDEAKKQAKKEADSQIADLKKALGDNYKKHLKTLTLQRAISIVIWSVC